MIKMHKKYIAYNYYVYMQTWVNSPYLHIHVVISFQILLWACNFKKNQMWIYDNNFDPWM